VVERIATLEELDSHWTLDDMARANALLDMKADVKATQAEKARQKRK
jgi:ABC-type uncharacterized transport system substrate-binding protein